MALGASQKEATSHVRDRALRMAMTPNLNSMTSVGIVSMPGMMTGQILGGNTPSEAAVTQIIIILLITVGTYAAAYFAIVLTRKNKFHEDGIPCFK
jgi:putative ABC transport system permease protein